MSKKKWFKGDPIVDFWNFVGQDIVFWNDKAYHRSWIHSQPFRLVVDNFRRGYYFYAVPIEFMGAYKGEDNGK